jgi:hypothetical protein
MSTMQQSKSTTTTLIANIYAYLLLAGSVVVMAIGVYMLAKNLLGRFVLDSYPLGYEETRCDYLVGPYMPMPANGIAGSEAQQEKERQLQEAQNEKAKAECEQSLAELRVRKEKTDFYEAAVLLLVGILLFVPHVIFANRLRK